MGELSTKCKLGHLSCNQNSLLFIKLVHFILRSQPLGGLQRQDRAGVRRQHGPRRVVRLAPLQDRLSSDHRKLNMSF